MMIELNNTVYALSVQHPFADLIVEGIKTIEVRSWKPPKHITQFVLCSGLQYSKIPCLTPIDELAVIGADLGHALGIMQIVDVTPFLPTHQDNACIEWQPKQNAWHLEVVHRIKPFPVKGQQRFFRLTDEQIKMIEVI